MDRRAPTCVITGANTGIGRVTAVAMAKRGYRLVLLGRSRHRTESALEEIAAASTVASDDPSDKASFHQLDLGSLKQVVHIAEKLKQELRAVDLLINNAGVAGIRGQSEDGFELAFGINHMGHFALTTQLLPLLQAAESCRVVTVASRAHYQAKGIDFEAARRPTQTRTGLAEYQVSKLANVLFARELQRRFGSDSFFSCSLHPGVVASDIWREVPSPIARIMKFFMLSNEQGAATTIHCAHAPAALKDNGAYFDSSKPKRASSLARDAQLATELWHRSERWLQAATG